MIWTGAFTAIVTPFTKKADQVDFDKFEDLIEKQISGGVSGVIILGTTGESPTLSEEESAKLIETGVRVAQGRCKIIACVGSNNTQNAVAKAKEVSAMGIDGIMVTAPGYSKPNPQGLFEHFKAVAAVTTLPILVYNVPSRTGINIPVSILEDLHQAFPHISGIKEASGDMDQIMHINRVFEGKNFNVLIGDDTLTFVNMALSGTGVVSVLSNALPEVMSSLVEHMQDGNFDKARALHFQYLPLMEAVMKFGNPMGIKALMGHLGLIENSFRLPLCPVTADQKKDIISAYGNVIEADSQERAA